MFLATSSPQSDVSKKEEKVMFFDSLDVTNELLWQEPVRLVGKLQPGLKLPASSETYYDPVVRVSRPPPSFNQLLVRLIDKSVWLNLETKTTLVFDDEGTLLRESPIVNLPNSNKIQKVDLLNVAIEHRGRPHYIGVVRFGDDRWVHLFRLDTAGSMTIVAPLASVSDRVAISLGGKFVAITFCKNFNIVSHARTPITASFLERGFDFQHSEKLVPTKVSGNVVELWVGDDGEVRLRSLLGATARWPVGANSLEKLLVPPGMSLKNLSLCNLKKGNEPLVLQSQEKTKLPVFTYPFYPRSWWEFVPAGMHSPSTNDYLFPKGCFFTNGAGWLVHQLKECEKKRSTNQTWEVRLERSSFSLRNSCVDVLVDGSIRKLSDDFLKRLPDDETRSVALDFHDWKRQKRKILSFI